MQYQRLQHYLWAPIRLLWLRLPLSRTNRQALKYVIFKYLPFLFFWSPAFKRWSAMGDFSNPDIRRFFKADMGFVNDLDAGVYVNRLEGDPLDSLPVRLIAFYLPQFHPIPENDLWWEEGFTEWTNVRPARPQFDGHYQPHVPGELDYYDLLKDCDIQRKQAELAKLYGVGGFCFYFYWFAGKTLLEKPIEKYLNDPEADFPFCLCWANENWTRRWDGLEHDVLISQKHSSEDDLAFIEHVSRYFRDRRYIRLNGRPLLIVYRPSELPDAKETVKRWRDWCSSSGLGEIYVACTQSLDMGDPDAYGMDAAIEFPPFNLSLPDLTNAVEPLSGDFLGDVRDWRPFVARSRHYTEPRYSLFRGVCPSWDNTARKKNKGTVFVNSTPNGYQEWLVNAIDDTCSRFADADERLVFVNAWNEWAEGAHLEPDQRYGYAYLEATRMAMLRSQLIWGHKALDGSPELAVVVHVVDVDVFRGILTSLGYIGRSLKLFVTTVKANYGVVKSLLSQAGFKHRLIMVAPLGRDIMPFIEILSYVEEDGYQCILRLHTRKYPHLEDGAVWNEDMFDKLLNVESVSASLELLCRQNVGIVSPEGHSPQKSAYSGPVDEQVLKLSERMGVARERLQSTSLVAGSIFFAKLDALKPLLNLAISPEDVQAGDDKMNCSLIESIFVISAMAGGYYAITLSSPMSPNALFVRD